MATAQKGNPRKKVAKAAAPAEIRLAELSTQELRDLAKDVEAEIKNRRVAQKKQVLAQMKEIAASRGFAVEEVLSTAMAKRRGAAAPAKVKYRNPDNPEQTWAGRGRKPGWLVELLAEGKRLEDLEA